ncbi:MAG: DMT family transporter [Vicinamibacterales bacterium]
MTATRFGVLDALLVLVVASWGANFSVIKAALDEFPVHTFNALRQVVAALSFAIVLWRMAPGERRVARGDVGRVIFLGMIGGAIYQLIFVSGVTRTSVANSGLIFGLTPVAVSILSSVLGHEKLGVTRWLGAVVSIVGLYFVVGHGAEVSSDTLVGDALVLVAMICWAIYSVVSRPLLGRYSPMMLTAWAAVIAAPPYVVAAMPSIVATDWTRVTWWGWALVLWSSLFCLVGAYVVWYTGVQKLGSTRTSAYSNLTPIFAMLVAWLWLGETVSVGQMVGALAIFAGVFLTRLSPVVLTSVDQN